MSAHPIGRAQVRAAARAVTTEELDDSRIQAAAHVICAMGGHIPNRDPEQPGACTFHQQQAAIALRSADGAGRS